VSTNEDSTDDELPFDSFAFSDAPSKRAGGVAALALRARRCRASGALGTSVKEVLSSSFGRTSGPLGASPPQKT